MKKKYEMIVNSISNLRNRASDFGNMVSSKWLLYSYVRTGYLVISIPTLVLLAGLHVPSLIIDLFAWATLLLWGLFIFLDTKGLTLQTVTPIIWASNQKNTQ